jgi:hypothetical protein
MSLPRIYADFHNLDDSNRLRLTCAGTREDLERLGIELQEGLELIFYMDDADDQGRPDELRVRGVVHFDGDHECWIADVDWSRAHHESAEAKQGIGA